MLAHRSGEAVALPMYWAPDGENLVESAKGAEAEPAEDTELIAGLHAGERARFDILFDRYSRHVFGTAWRVLGDATEAEEVAQEVFFYVYRRSEIFDPAKGSVKAWINQITVSRALDRKLYLARQHAHPGLDSRSLELAGETDLEQEVETKLIREHLERALAELTRMQRLTIEFFYFEGLELKEISERLAAPLGAVRHYLYSGLERLRKNPDLYRLPCK